MIIRCTRIAASTGKLLHMNNDFQIILIIDMTTSSIIQDIFTALKSSFSSPPWAVNSHCSWVPAMISPWCCGRWPCSVARRLGQAPCSTCPPRWSAAKAMAWPWTSTAWAACCLGSHGDAERSTWSTWWRLCYDMRYVPSDLDVIDGYPLDVLSIWGVPPNHRRLASYK